MTTPSGCVSAVLEGCLKQTLISRLDVFWVQKKAAAPGLKMSERQKAAKTTKELRSCSKMFRSFPLFCPG